MGLVYARSTIIVHNGNNVTVNSVVNYIDGDQWVIICPGEKGTTLETTFCFLYSLWVVRAGTSISVGVASGFCDFLASFLSQAW